MKPADVIGSAAVNRLRLAGFEIVPRPAPERYTLRWTCACGAVHAPKLGFRADVYADFGMAWHRPCVPPRKASWRPAEAGFYPMLEERVPLP